MLFDSSRNGLTLEGDPDADNEKSSHVRDKNRAENPKYLDRQNAFPFEKSSIISLTLYGEVTMARDEMKSK